MKRSVKRTVKKKKRNKKGMVILISLVTLVVFFAILAAIPSVKSIRFNNNVAGIYTGNQKMQAGHNSPFPAFGLYIDSHITVINLGVAGIHFYKRLPIGVGVYKLRYFIYKGIFSEKIFTGPSGPEIHIELLPIFQFHSKYDGIKIVIITIGLNTFSIPGL